MPASATVIISHYQFTIPTPYTAGHPLTEAEASAFNTYRTELIRKTFLRRVEALSMPGALLSPEALNQLQSDIDEFAAEFRFATSTPPARKSALQIELEAVFEEAYSSLRDEAIEAGEEPLKDIDLKTFIEWEARRRLLRRLQALGPEELGL